MRKFWAMYLINLREALAYRGQLFFYLALSLLTFGVAFLFWSAVYAERTTVAGYTFTAMITYYFLASVCENIVAVWLEFGVERIVRDGTLTGYLLRPMSYHGFQFSDTLAWKTVYVAMLVVTFIAVATLLRGQLIIQTNVGQLALTVLALIAAFLCFFMVSSLLALSAFWMLKIYSVVSIARYSLIPLLSGSVVPIALFPAAVQQVLWFTPFPYLVGFPANVYLGQVSSVEYLRGMAVVTAWTLVLWWVSRFAWQHAFKRYEAVGA